jgi:hypothetical protein
MGKCRYVGFALGPKANTKFRSKGMACTVVAQTTKTSAVHPESNGIVARGTVYRFWAGWIASRDEIV